MDPGSGQSTTGTCVHLLSQALFALEEYTNFAGCRLDLSDLSRAVDAFVIVNNCA